MLQAALLLLNFACDATFICYNTVEHCRTDLQKYKSATQQKGILVMQPVT